MEALGGLIDDVLTGLVAWIRLLFSPPFVWFFIPAAAYGIFALWLRDQRDADRRRAEERAEKRRRQGGDGGEA